MKIKITYSPDEWLIAESVASAIKSLLPSVKVKETDEKPPYKHIYISLKEAKSNKNVKK